MRVLVCGGRDYQRRDRVFEVLGELSDGVRMTVIHGGCRTGADSFAGEWAAERGDVEVYPADWKTHGRAAGPIRNREMLEKGKPDMVVAFPGGRGTANMVELARAAGVTIIHVDKHEKGGTDV